MIDIMDWHMYLILFIAIIVFIGIALLLERAKKQPKDPLSIWNPENFSLYFDCDTGPRYLESRNDTEFDPAFHGLPANVWHRHHESHYIKVGDDPIFDPIHNNLNKY